MRTKIYFNFYISLENINNGKIINIFKCMGNVALLKIINFIFIFQRFSN